MKTFEHAYDWTDRTEWFLPEDEEMMQAQFPILDEQIDAVLEAISHVNGNQHMCVQAGGCFGMYPIRLAYHFNNVATFEPFEKNHAAMLMNFMHHPDLDIVKKIVPRAFALYDTQTMLRMEYPRPQDRAVSNGAMRCTDERGEVPSASLDLFQFPETVDLIWLDVEGMELRALIGAQDTIKEQRPVVVIEERDFPWQKNYSMTPAQWLEARGYRRFGKTHADAIFVPE